MTLAKPATAYDTPVVVSTAAVNMGVNQGTAQVVLDELPGAAELDRIGANAWEDPDARVAIEATDADIV